MLATLRGSTQCALIESSRGLKRYVPTLLSSQFHSTAGLHSNELIRLRRYVPTSTLLSSQFHSTCTAGFHSNELIGTDYVVQSPLPAIQPPTEDLYTQITKDFPKHGSSIALVNGISGREYSFNELGEMFSKFSSAIRRIGFSQGDVMGIVAPNSPEFPVLILGTLAAGGVVSTSNPAFTASELAYQFKNSNTKITVTIPEFLLTVQEAAAKSQVEKIIVVDASNPQSSRGDLLSYSALMADCGPPLEPVRTAPEDVAILPYSSGTTSLPKGVMLTNFSVGSNFLQLSHPELMGVQESSIVLGILPFYHVYGMAIVLLASLRAGAKLISLPKFEPGSFLSAIERYKVNFGHVAPPLVVFLAKHPLVEKYDVTSMQDITTGAAPLSGDMITEACERTGCRLIRQSYGLTETSPVAHMMPRSLGMEFPSSIGHCLPSVKVKIVDPERGESLPPNKEGEVWISGPNLMKGYLNNPTATQDCLTEDGWLKSGDLGYYDEQGLFYITDRLKELIKVKGLQVAPAELEALLLTHPKIADAAVVGVPNEWLGEAPRAFVVRRDGSLSEKEVEEFVAGKLAKHKHLAGGVTFIEEVPKSASGKMLRRVLKV